MRFKKIYFTKIIALTNFYKIQSFEVSSIAYLTLKS